MRKNCDTKPLTLVFWACILYVFYMFVIRSEAIILLPFKRPKFNSLHCFSDIAPTGAFLGLHNFELVFIIQVELGSWDKMIKTCFFGCHTFPNYFLVPQSTFLDLFVHLSASFILACNCRIIQVTVVIFGLHIPFVRQI